MFVLRKLLRGRHWVRISGVHLGRCQRQYWVCPVCRRVRREGGQCQSHRGMQFERSACHGLRCAKGSVHGLLRCELRAGMPSGERSRNGGNGQR